MIYSWHFVSRPRVVQGLHGLLVTSFMSRSKEFKLLCNILVTFFTKVKTCSDNMWFVFDVSHIEAGRIATTAQSTNDVFLIETKRIQNNAQSICDVFCAKTGRPLTTMNLSVCSLYRDKENLNYNLQVLFSYKEKEFQLLYDLRKTLCASRQKELWSSHSLLAIFSPGILAG